MTIHTFRGMHNSLMALSSCSVLAITWSVFLDAIQRSIAKRANMIFATSWWRGYLSKKAWRRWQRTSQLRKSKCIALHQAITQCSHTQFIRAWKAWRTYAKESIQRRHFVAKAILFWQHKHLARMWLAWSHWIAHKHDKHQILQKAIHWCMHVVSFELTACIHAPCPISHPSLHSTNIDHVKNYILQYEFASIWFTCVICILCVNTQRQREKQVAIYMCRLWQRRGTLGNMLQNNKHG